MSESEISWDWRRVAGLAGAILLVTLYACGGGDETEAPVGGGSGDASPGIEFDGTVPDLPPALAAAKSAGTPIISWNAHAGARLEPCGCVAGMHGGLVRRATLLHRLDPAQLLTVEAGGWSGGSADYQLVRAGFYLRGLGASDCDAVGLGAAEVALGAEALRSLVALSPVPIVAANVESTDGTPLAEIQTAVSFGGQDAIVTSVVPATAKGDGLRVSDPSEAVLAVQAAHPGATLVVIADLNEAGLQELAVAVPGLAVVIGGKVSQPSRQPIKVGATRIVHVANEGKTIGYWPMGSEDCTFDLITDDIPDHPELRALVHRYQETLGGMDLAIDDRIAGMTTLQGSEQADNHYVGSEACTACHSNAAAIHKDSRHFHSLETLQEKNYHHDPDCLRCHVTGLAMKDGYSRRSERPGVGLVSCEACHGRGAIHVRERKAGRPASGSLQVVTPATCVKCHDGENSPHFLYGTYWAKIKHDAK